MLASVAFEHFSANIQQPYSSSLQKRGRQIETSRYVMDL